MGAGPNYRQGQPEMEQGLRVSENKGLCINPAWASYILVIIHREHSESQVTSRCWE